MFTLGFTHAVDPSHNKAALWGSVLLHNYNKFQVFLSGLLFSVAHFISFTSIFYVLFLIGKQFDIQQYSFYLHIFSGTILILLGLWFIFTGKFHRHHNEEHEHTSNYSVALISGFIPCPSSLITMVSMGMEYNANFDFSLLITYGIGATISTILSLLLFAILGEKIMQTAFFKNIEHRLHTIIGFLIILIGVVNLIFH